MAYYKYTGTSPSTYPTLGITAQPGNVYDLNPDMTLPDNKWVATSSTATVVNPVTYASQASVLYGRGALLSGVTALPEAEVAMASPPTVADSLTATLTGALYRQDTYCVNAYSSSGGPLTSPAFWRSENNPTQAVWYPSQGAWGMETLFGGNPMPLSTIHDFYGDKIEFLVRGGLAGFQYRVNVDGQYVNITPTTTAYSGGAFVNILVTFASAAHRRVRLETYGTEPIGVSYAKTQSLNAPSAPRKPVCYLLSDSIGASTNATNMFTRWHYRLGRIMGWDVWSNSLGGSGYVNPGPGGQNSVTIQSRLNSYLPVMPKPDVIMFVAGVNDGTNNGYTSAQLQAAAAQAYATCAALAPGVPVIVVLPFPISTGDTAQNLASVAQSRVDIKVAASAAANVVKIIEPIIYPAAGAWITSDQSPTYITANPHPSQLGHDYFARQVAANITPSFPVS